jgi:hypothetical protein
MKWINMKKNIFVKAFKRMGPPILFGQFQFVNHSLRLIQDKKMKCARKRLKHNLTFTMYENINLK